MASPKVNLEEEFALSTTCHGISHLYTSRNRCLTVFWVLLIFGMTGALISQISSRIVTYFQYETSTDISEEFVSFLTFPAITICSFDRFLLENATRREREAIYQLNHLSSTEHIAFLQEKQEQLDLSKIVDYFGEDINITEYSVRNGFTITKEIMPLCRFKASDCLLSEFTPVLTSMGKCYSFNERQMGRIQNIPGPGHGLRVILDMRHHNSAAQPLHGNSELGLKLQIHPQYEAPDVETSGISIPVGQKAFIRIQQTDNDLMYEPWGKCQPLQEKLRYFSVYTLNNCIQECYTKEVISKCRCRLYTQYWARDFAPECTIYQMSECAAPHLVYVKQTFSASQCNCSIPCKFVEFDVSVTYSSFPNQPTIDYLQGAMNYTEEEIRKNVLKFEVFFSSMSFKRFKQSKKVDVTSLLSDIGGQLGLWVGMSLITLVEFVQYVIQKLHQKQRDCLAYIRTKKNKVQEDR